MPYWIDENKKVGNLMQVSYCIDSAEDLGSLPTSKSQGDATNTIPPNDTGISAKCGIGSSALCIDDGKTYYLNSLNVWTEGGSGEYSDYTLYHRVSPAQGNLLGKDVNDLQRGVTAEFDPAADTPSGTISGTLMYIQDYTGYSDTVSLQSGNYLALNLVIPFAGATISAGIDEDEPVEPDANGNVVLRVPSDAEGVTVYIESDGDSQTYSYAVDGLAMQTDED